jgi:hypothetical protein
MLKISIRRSPHQRHPPFNAVGAPLVLLNRNAAGPNDIGAAFA